MTEQLESFGNRLMLTVDLSRIVTPDKIRLIDNVRLS